MGKFTETVKYIWDHAATPWILSAAAIISSGCYLHNVNQKYNVIPSRRQAARLNRRAERVQSKELQEKIGFSGIDLSYYAENGFSTPEATGKYSELERKTIECLKLANIIVDSRIDYEVTRGYDPDKALKRAKGDCETYAEMTYTQFFAITERLKLTELRDYAKFTEGVSGGEHAYLEIKLKGKWIPYETTVLKIPNGPVMYPTLATIFVKDNNVLRDPSKYIRKVSLQIDSSGEIHIISESRKSSRNVAGVR
ncbi:hypothetical protein GOV06_02790 [Candidatus Woesearchaeota archaeon]|nr:hypothetical protein [Candidatus Woesearchaeota archaeon]